MASTGIRRAWILNDVEAMAYETCHAGGRTGRVGGFVSLGVRTSKMSIKEMSNMIELCLAFGSQQGVRFTAPEWRCE